jgi:hypothetical protein
MVVPSIINKRLSFDPPLVDVQMVLPSMIKSLSDLDPPLVDVQNVSPSSMYNRWFLEPPIVDDHIVHINYCFKIKNKKYYKVRTTL